MIDSGSLIQPPLNVRLPTAVRQLVRSVDVGELGQRYTSLEAIVQAYNELLHGMSGVDRMLFQHKLQLVDSVSYTRVRNRHEGLGERQCPLLFQLLSMGLDSIHWQSTDFPDFIAKSKAMIQGDLHCAVSRLNGHTGAVRRLTESWSQFPGLDMFAEGREETLEELERKYACVLESMEHFLPPTVRKITSHLHHAFEVSQWLWMWN